MSEMHDPPLRLQVQAVRFVDGEWRLSGDAASITFYGTDESESPMKELLLSMREAVNLRLRTLIPLLGLSYGALDWDAPNAPTVDDLGRLVAQSQMILEALSVLKCLAPEIIETDGIAEADGSE